MTDLSGEYMRVWAKEVPTYEEEGWREIGRRPGAWSQIHGPGFESVWLYRKREGRGEREEH